MFWLSIGLALITHFRLQGIPIGFAAILAILAILANLTMIPEAFGAPYVQAVYWTLSVELMFYGLCYLLFLRGLNENRHVLAGMAFILAALFALYQNARVGPFQAVGGLLPFMPGDFAGETFGHLSIMFWGALCRLEYERHNRFLSGSIAVLALFWLALQTAQNPAETVRLFVPYPIAIALFLVLLFRVKLRFGFLVWLGQVSYSLYLLHDVVIYALGWLRTALIPWFVPGIVGYVLISATAAILVSAITYRLIEYPAHMLGTRLGKRMDAKGSAFGSGEHAQPG